MKTLLKLNFTASQVNDNFMSLDVSVNNKDLTTINVAESFVIEKEIDLPATVKFIISGKTPSDTIVVNNQIVADKFLKLESIELDNFKIETWRISTKYLKFLNGSEFTNYWGTNGEIEFALPFDDPFICLIELDKFN